MINVHVPPASLGNPNIVGFIRMLNEEHSIALKPADLIIGAPQVQAGGAARNTRIQLTAAENAEFAGSKFVEYQRNNLSEVFIKFWGTSINAALNMRGFTDLHEALPTLNWEYGLDLATSDVPNHTFDHGQGNYTHTLVVDSSCLLYVGQLELHLYDMDWAFGRVANGAYRVTDSGALRVTR